MSNLSDFTIVDGKLTAYHGTGGELVIPSSVIEIDSDVFRNNNTITSVVIPDTVVKIGWESFANCENLSVLDVSPKTVDIHPSAFSGCPKLADQDGFVIINRVLFYSYGNDAEQYAKDKYFETVLNLKLL